MQAAKIANQTAALAADQKAQYNELLSACAAEICAPEHRALFTEVDDLIDSARVNADDTVYTEQAAPESEWASLFLGSLQGALASGCCTVRAIAWFKHHGVTF